MNDYHRIAKRDDRCSLCGGQASHKVAEDTYDHRHPFTNYLCCGCFGQVMGSLAVEWCAREDGVPVGGGEPQPDTDDNERAALTAMQAETDAWQNAAGPSFVRSAAGGDQPDTPCPHCNDTRRVPVLFAGYDLTEPCPACTGQENPDGQ